MVPYWLWRGPGAFHHQYALARDAGYERLADELVEISDSDCTVDGKPDNALVQQARLRVDTRKWLLSKMLPKRYGDRITAEIAGDPNAPLITRIELVPIDPRPRQEDLSASGGNNEATVTPLRALPSR